MVRPETLRRRLQKLDEFIDEGDRDTWQDMIGFRNVLVHEYADIDRRTVYAALQENLDDICRLSHVFDRFLE